MVAASYESTNPVEALRGELAAVRQPSVIRKAGMRSARFTSAGAPKMAGILSIREVGYYEPNAGAGLSL
jgi:hypothetical protein